MRIAALAFLFFLPALALAQPRPVDSPIVMGGARPTPEQVKAAQAILEAVKPQVFTWNVGEFQLIVKGVTAKGELTWDVSNEDVVGLKEIPAGAVLFVENAIRAGDKQRQDYEFEAQKDSYFRAKALKPGKTLIRVWANGDGGTKPKVIAKLDVTVTDPAPPTPPVPPGPTPPGPGPAPIPQPGFRVLVVYESAELTKMPTKQLYALRAKDTIDYLESHCVKENGHAEWRMYDKDAPLTNDTQVWKDAMARPRQSVPWLLVTNGKDGYEGPLPPDQETLMKLLKQYGGN